MSDPTESTTTPLPADPTPSPRLPTNWAVKAIDVSIDQMRSPSGFQLPSGWQPLGILLRGTQPVLIMYIETA